MLFFSFLIIDLYFLIPAVIVQILNSTEELLIVAVIATTVVNTEIETSQ